MAQTLVQRLKRRRLSGTESICIAVAVAAVLVFVRGEDTRTLTKNVAGEVRIVQQDRCAPPKSLGRPTPRQLAACERLLDRLLALMTPAQRERLARTGDRPRPPASQRHQPPPPTGLPQPTFPPSEPPVAEPAPTQPEPQPDPSPQNPPGQPDPQPQPQPPPEPLVPLLPVPKPVCDLLRPLEAC